MEHFRIAPVSEADARAMVEAAGGRVAHPDYERRSDKGADPNGTTLSEPSHDA